MLKHIVLFTFKPTSTVDEITTIVNHFKNLKELVPEVLDLDFGINISPENFHQDFTHCFSLTFKSLDTLAAYQIDKHHLEFQNVLQAHMEKVFVVDYYID